MIGVRSCGVFGVLPGTVNDVLSFGFGKRRAGEQPWAIRQGVMSLDLTRFCGEPERLRRDPEEARGLAQIEPRLVPVGSWPKHRDLVVRPEGGDPFPGPAVAMPGRQAVAVEDACNQIIIGDEHQLPDSSDDVG